MRYEVISFQGSQIMTIEDGGVVSVVMKPVCEALGLHWHGQRERIYRHPVLAEGARVTRVPSASGEQETVVLDLECFHGWLVTISSERIEDVQKRELIVRYQREAFRVIYEHFHGPMRGKGLMPPVKEMIALQKERARLMMSYQREPREAVRRGYYEDLCRTTQRLGGAAPPWEETETARALENGHTPSSVFAGLDRLTALGVKWNVHCKPEQFCAFNPADLGALFRVHGIDIVLDEPTKAALAASVTPTFLRYAPYRTVAGRMQRCFIFEARTG